MVIKKTPQRRIFEICNIIIMLALVVVTLYPMIYIIFASFSVPIEFLAHRGLLFRPLGFDTIAYEKAFTHPLLLSGYGNTLFVVIVGVCVNILLTSIAAYFLSRENVLWQRPIAFFIIFTMYFSGGIIPMYLTVTQDFNLQDSLWSLILPVAINTFNLMIMRTGLAAVPASLEESARIDGAGHFTILFRIVLPLAMPTVAVMILYYGVFHWNSWFNASLFILSPDKYPLQLVLRQILLSNDTASMTGGVDAGSQLAVSETLKYAIIIIATVPILCVYPFLQRYFVKGVMIGAVKG
ncbi:carbohydrate ABC transporter permease [Ructibacterium gallinarum]|uniref:Carbohydrate ABC transporter permease n=1 Tax=Ructibacterium gallinarum TaxID=2779355 RepID=A0A9D5M5W3_9FIRM|nr:carbohydrate ABC transporter permease [Ructibacterium gallinarum]MBE5040052.1 carbohydrate ABC transporter permease [Ructibacterium gallinarum]